MRYGLMTLAMFTVFIAPMSSVCGQQLPASANNQPKVTELPDSEPDLNRLKAETEQQIKDADAAKKAWSSIVASLQTSKNAIAQVGEPDYKAAIRARQFAKSKEWRKAIAEIQSLYTAFEEMGRVAAPPYSLVQAPSQQQSSVEAVAFVTTWQNKMYEIGRTIFPPQVFSSFSRVFYNPQSALDVGADDIERATSALTQQAFQESRSKYANALDTLLSEATAEKNKATTDLSTAQDLYGRIVAKLGKAKMEINQLAIELGLPLFCGTVLLMLCVPIVVQRLTKFDEGSRDEIRAIFASGILVEVITVLLLTMSILILGLAGKIQGEVLGTLLGGISGYVLNRFRRSGPKEDADISSPPPHPAPPLQHTE